MHEPFLHAALSADEFYLRVGKELLYLVCYCKSGIDVTRSSACGKDNLHYIVAFREIFRTTPISPSCISSAVPP